MDHEDLLHHREFGSRDLALALPIIQKRFPDLLARDTGIKDSLPTVKILNCLVLRGFFKRIPTDEQFRDKNT